MPRKDQPRSSRPLTQNPPSTASDPDPKEGHPEELQDPQVQIKDGQGLTISAEGSDPTSQKKSFINTLTSEDEDKETKLLFAQMKDLRNKLRGYADIEDFYEALVWTIDMLADVQAEVSDLDAAAREDEEDPGSKSDQQEDLSPEWIGNEKDANRGLNEGVDDSDGAPKALGAPRRSPRLGNAYPDVKAYSFTGVKREPNEFFGRTGIDEVFADISEETLSVEIKHPTHDEDFDRFWEDTSIDGLIVPMRRSDEFLCPLSESGCRWSIDRVAEYLMRGLTYCKVAIPTVYTELPVSQVNKKDSKKKTQAVVAIIWRSKKTILTGRYDYLFLTFPYIKTRVIDPRKLELLEQNSFPTIRAKLTSFWLGRVRLFVLEAKRLMSAEALHAQLPQVIAQSRAAMKFGTPEDEGKEDGIPFCLSTGQLWIFGFLHRPKGAAEEVKLKVYKTQALKWDLEKPLQMKQIFEALTVWMSVPTAQIMDMLKAQS